MVSGTKTHECISLLLLSYTKFIHIEEGHYFQITEKRRKARTKIEDFSENFSLDKQGTHFYLQKVKVTRLALTISYHRDNRTHHKASSARITIGSWLENARVQLTMKNELPLCLNKKKQPNLISPGQKHNHIPGAMCDSTQKASFNLFCAFEHTQKPIWFSLKGKISPDF